MVNRILIRLKVVQMLYSFMLTRSDFRIEPAPEKQTRDSIYAYNLYLELLLLIIRLGGLRVAPNDKFSLKPVTKEAEALHKLQLPRLLSTLPEIRHEGAVRLEELAKYDELLTLIAEKTGSSSALKDYSKKRDKSISKELAVWKVLLNNVIKTMPEFAELCRKSDNFSLSGMERAFVMLNNTLSDYVDVRSALMNAKRSLNESLMKAYELYFNLMWLPVELTRLREQQLEQAKDKYLPSDNDLNPNLKFVENKLVKHISESPDFAKFFKEHPTDLPADYFNLKELLDLVLKSEIYQKYMADETRDFNSDCEFWRQILKDVIFPSDALAEMLESKSVYWNDDLYIIGTFALKAFRKLAVTGEKLEILEQFKDAEDENFGPELFSMAITHADEYRELINAFVKSDSWDADRLAFMDLVILTAAIAEIVGFEKIPVPVSINEYIEIANFYSTARSGQFINGILFAIISRLKEEGKLNKQIN